jgi:signal transduction histidine kinase
MSVAVAGVVIYGYIRFYFVWDEFLGVDRFAVRSIYLLVLAYMFGLLSEFEDKQNRKLLALSKTAGELAKHEERRRISQELHDGLLQSLATHIVKLETCRRQFPGLPRELQADLKSIEDDTRVTMKTIRQFLSGEDTQPFPPGMLTEKLKDDLTFMRDGLGLRIIFEMEPESLNLPDKLEREFYFVIREGLMNISRHSHASRAELFITQVDDTIRVTLSDDGVGLDQAASKNGTGLGLQTMKERIERFGGKLFIDSSPGVGTKISFVLPLPQITSTRAA